MWMVDPKFMCRKHLLGEHVELHMFVSHINAGKRVTGYIWSNCLEPRSINKRHSEIVREMKRRGYNHNSPLPKVKLSKVRRDFRNIKVNRKLSLIDLLLRCEDCCERVMPTRILYPRGHHRREAR